MELKPCPFCSSDELSVDDSPGDSFVECARCSASGPHAGDKEEAARRWNERSATE